MDNYAVTITLDELLNAYSYLDGTAGLNGKPTPCRECIAIPDKPKIKELKGRKPYQPHPLTDQQRQEATEKRKLTVRRRYRKRMFGHLYPIFPMEDKNTYYDRSKSFNFINDEMLRYFNVVS